MESLKTNRPKWMTDFYDSANPNYEGWIKSLEYGAVEDKDGTVSEQVWLTFSDITGEEWFAAIADDKSVELNTVLGSDSMEYFGTTTFEKLVEHLNTLPITARKKFRC